MAIFSDEWKDMSLKQRKADRAPGFNRAREQETKVANLFRGERIKGSGNGDTKGDVRVRGVTRIECKTTTKESYSLRLKDMDTISRAAVGAGEIPAMVIQFEGDSGKSVAEVAVIPMWALQELLS